MPLLGFTVLKDKLLDGTKKQTIRKMRKHPINEGDKLYLYWHCRQKDCEKLGEALCTEVMTIQIYSEYWAGKQRPLLIRQEFQGMWNNLSPEETLKIVLRDGFENEDDFLKWFIGHYGEGEIYQVIRWNEISVVR